ncbi:MAG: glycosyl transferase group 1, partial [Frankiales bacterium]|nr:glycosyl transferase group 1 [Frankiales bacterium]
MRVDVLSSHLPAAEGTAAGRVLLATCEGLLAEGVDVAVTSWAPEEPSDLPSWCTWTPVPPEPAWRTRSRALLRPRSDVTRIGWAPRGIAVADDPLSAAALPPGGVATLLYATTFDVDALGRRPYPKEVQDLRADRRLRDLPAARVLTYSDRVAAWVGGTTVPIAVPVPDGVLPQVDEPVAAMVADWRWEPNRMALRTLLHAWPRVRGAIPTARLLIAGRGDLPTGSQDGIEFLGPVARSVDVLERAAVLAFPCPDSSGPKVKVLEAAALGLAVVTTAGGAEGLASDAVVVSDLDG